MKFLIDRFLFSDQILNFCIMELKFSTFLLLPSNGDSALGISVADISKVKTSFYV